MRKVPVIFLIIIFIGVALEFVIIPNVLNTNSFITVPMKRDGLFRKMTIDNSWKNLLNENPYFKDSATKFVYRGNVYDITYKTVSSVMIDIHVKNNIFKSALVVIPHEPDSTTLVWSMNLPTSKNPIKRFSIYNSSKIIEHDLNELLEKIRSNYSTIVNVYGIDIKKEEVKDSILVSTHKTINGYPSDTYIYSLINNLKTFVKKGTANITGHPMLNISTQDSIQYLVRVALPVDKALSSNEEFSYKRMMGKGKILRSRVTGGYGAIKTAMEEINNFVQDNHYVNPAIPFQSLITDRTVTDSSKWETDIYFPVM